MKIISMDGGGIRGVITAVLLKRLEERNPGMLAKTDFFAGTSTGGLLALALAAEMPIDTIINVYKEKGAYIFSDSIYDDIKDIEIAGVSLLGAKYNIIPLWNVLIDLFPSEKLKDLKKKVLVAAFDLRGKYNGKEMGKPKFFTNYDGSDDDVFVADAGCATAAAPTYFPTHKTFIDGGVFAANPSMCAIAQVGFQKDINLLRVGTGGTDFTKPIKGGDHDWGIWKWFTEGNLIEIMMNATKDIARYQCEIMLKDKYCNLNPPLDKSIDMDDYKEVPYMIEFAMRQNIDEADEYIKTKWMV